MSKNVAIFASGSGSNAEHIIRYFEDNETVNVRLVVSNRNTAYVLARAKALNIPSVVFSREEWQEATPVLDVLRQYDIDFIVLAGFLAYIPSALLHTYPNRIINIHPSLLPKYGGKGMYGDHVHRAVVAAGETETGITIHYINEHYDEGEVIFQATCPVLPGDSSEDVAEKVHALEYANYPKVIENIIR